MTQLQIPEYVLYICATLRDAGYEAYVVGGGVRDALLGRIPKDWDVATDAPPQRVQQLFPRTVATGIEFGTVTVLVRIGDPVAAEGEPGHQRTAPATTNDNEARSPTSAALSGGADAAAHSDGTGHVWAVEVTTFRGESGYADGRRPDEVQFIGSIEDDLVRRDFTVNAIAYDPFGQRLVDPHGGRADLARRLIHAVGDPDERFGEDGLRVLRAIRLATELGFDIQSDTGLALQRNGPALRHISRERIGQEWQRVIVAPAAGRGLRLLAQFDLLPFMLVIDADELEVGETQWMPTSETITRIATALDRLQRDGIASDENSRIYDHAPYDDGFVTPTAVLLHGLGSPEQHRRWLRNLVYSRQNVRATLQITAAMSRFNPTGTTTDSELRRFLSQLGRINIASFLRAWTAWHPADGEATVAERIGRIVTNNDALATNELALGGQDVLTITGISPGPVVGRILERLLEHVLTHPEDNDRERLTTLLLSWMKDDDLNVGPA